MLSPTLRALFPSLAEVLVQSESIVKYTNLTPILSAELVCLRWETAREGIISSQHCPAWSVKSDPCVGLGWRTQWARHVGCRQLDGDQLSKFLFNEAICVVSDLWH